MKKNVILLAFLGIVFSVNAQKPEYYNMMGQNLQKMSQAKTEADYQSISNQFELIANVETGEWLPLYYAAHATVLMVHTGIDDDKIDSYLDLAQKFVDKALKINPNESEIHVLQGFLHQARIGVNPMTRGMKYVGIAQESFDKAKELNPDNPRVYYLSAMSIYNTPAMFGGGKKKALPLFLQAKEKFDKYKPGSPIAPSWGSGSNKEMLAVCQK